MALNLEQIVAKYTKRQYNETSNGTKLRPIMATNTKEIVAKYTQNNKHDELEERPSRSSFVPKSASSPTALAFDDKWTLWAYNCGDFPVHINNKMPCPFCLELCKLRILFKDSFYEGNKDRWENYLQKEKSFTDNGHDAMPPADELGDLLPSKLAKNIFFNRKLGAAVFRDGITPNLESAENKAGGVFRMLFFASTGQRSAPLLAKFDTLFLHSLRLILHAPPTIGRHVNGLFLRWEIDSANGRRIWRKNLGGPLKGEWETERRKAEQRWDVDDLPIVGKLEVWISDLMHKKLLKEFLISSIECMIRKLEFPSNSIKHFIFCVRVRGDAFLDNEYTQSLKTCSIDTFNALKSEDFQ